MLPQCPAFALFATGVQVKLRSKVYARSLLARARQDKKESDVTICPPQFADGVSKRYPAGYGMVCPGQQCDQDVAVLCGNTGQC
jgi:hypothetical protein